MASEGKRKIKPSQKVVNAALEESDPVRPKKKGKKSGKITGENDTKPKGKKLLKDATVADPDNANEVEGDNSIEHVTLASQRC
jgi:hypothetical protein